VQPELSGYAPRSQAILQELFHVTMAVDNGDGDDQIGVNREFNPRSRLLPNRLVRLNELLLLRCRRPLQLHDPLNG